MPKKKSRVINLSLGDCDGQDDIAMRVVLNYDDAGLCQPSMKFFCRSKNIDVKFDLPKDRYNSFDDLVEKIVEKVKSLFVENLTKSATQSAFTFVQSIFSSNQREEDGE